MKGGIRENGQASEGYRELGKGARQAQQMPEGKLRESRDRPAPVDINAGRRKRSEHRQFRYFGMLSNNETGYIILDQFTEGCSNQVKDALVSLKAKGCKNIILDLRENPGGLLNEAVNIVNLFIDKGIEVVSSKGKVAEWDKAYLSVNNPIDTQIPVIVLVNERSASASEIVSGALQDLDRAVVIGQRTYGKGLVQQTRDLIYNAKVKVTVAKYYITKWPLCSGVRLFAKR